MLPPKPRIQTYKEFWPVYLKEHRKRATRRWHALGTSLGLLLALTALFTGHALWIPLALVPAYAIAWYSHFFVEGNRPATFKYPVWSFLSDFRMLYWMLTGRL
jgi:hypothetical protein